VIDLATKNRIGVVIVDVPSKFSRDLRPLFYRAVYEGRELEVSNYAVDSSFDLKSVLPVIEQKNVFVLYRSSLFDASDTFEYMGFKVPYSLDGNHISTLGSISAYKNFKNEDTFIELIQFMSSSVNR